MGFPKKLTRDLCVAVITIILAAMAMFIYLQPNPLQKGPAWPTPIEATATHPDAPATYEEGEALLMTALVVESATLGELPPGSDLLEDGQAPARQMQSASSIAASLVPVAA